MVNRHDSTIGGPAVEQEDPVVVHYEKTVAEATVKVVAHLHAHPDDAALSPLRHEGGLRTLYAAVVEGDPGFADLRLTSLMWDQAVSRAIAIASNTAGASPGGAPADGDAE